MWRFGLRQLGHFAQKLLGAVLLAACVSALAGSVHARPVVSFARSLLARLVAMANLDFGASAVTALPAWTELSRCLPATLELVALGALAAILAGVPAALLLSERSAMRLGAPLVQVLSAVPVFCVALALLWLSQQLLHWTGDAHARPFMTALASGNMQEIEVALRSLALPALTVGIAGAYAVQNLLRRAIASAANEPYRKGLRALGLGRLEIDGRYLLPQVLGAFFFNLGEIVTALIGAAAVAEWVFAWPGAAGLFLKSVALRDWTVAGLVLFVFAALTIAAEFAGAIVARVLAETEAMQ